MEAHQLKLSQFLSTTDTHFIIPVYQRNYDWVAKSHCKQLLDDIEAVGGDTTQVAHFIGSIVYIHDGIYTSKTRELTIIDGQQRLTTLTLLYIALLDWAKGENLTTRVEQIREQYLINKFAEGTEKLKLRPTANNADALRFLLNRAEGERYPGRSRLIENYDYLKSRINSANAEMIQTGLGKLVFVEISLERGKDDPQKIFESLNSTGLDLSQSDLIRNYILMGTKYSEQERLYERYWKVIESNATHEATNTNRVSDFVRDYLTAVSRDIPNKGAVYQAFKNKYAATNVGEIEQVLTKIKRYSGYYYRLINPDLESDFDIGQELRAIAQTDVNVIFPFLLDVFEDLANGVIEKQVMVAVLRLIQSYTWRRFIVGLPTNALNKIFMRLYEDVQKEDYLPSIQRSLMRRTGKQRFPNDQEVVTALKEKDVYNTQRRYVVYLLEKLENHENNERVTMDESPKITIEHIFPQDPEKLWREKLSGEDYSTLQEKYLNTVANLTLSGNNGPLGNRYFTAKRDMNKDGGEQGYKFSRLWLNRYLKDLDRWDVAELEKRFTLISERFLKIWPSPPVPATEETIEVEVNIFEAEDPTNRRLASATLLDDHIDVRTVTDLYSVCLTTLFVLYPDAFSSKKLLNPLHLTTDPAPLRTALALNDTYYVEKGYSNKQKFDIIKLLLSTTDLTDELYIKYAPVEKA